MVVGVHLAGCPVTPAAQASTWYQDMLVDLLVDALHSAGYFTDLGAKGAVRYVHVKTRDWIRPTWKFKCGHIGIDLAGKLDYSAVAKEHEKIFTICQTALGLGI